MTAQIMAPSGAAHGRLMSVAGYRPARIVTNDELCARIDSSDEWIRERSGIIERRYAAQDESVADMAVLAAKEALDSAGVDPADVSMVMLATVTHPYQTPSAAAEVAYRIGAVTAAAMDIGAACAGFCYGLEVANSLIRTGSARYVVLVGVEKLSDWINPDDRGTAFLFADGAGAVVVGPSDTPAIGPVVWGSDGSQLDAITMTRSLIDFKITNEGAFPALTMQGQQVFRWAVGEMAKKATEALKAAGVKADELDAFIPHQANMRITDAMVRALKLPDDVPVARDIALTGNTSAASIPLAMQAMLDAGEAPHGGTALLIGFGAGLVFASQVVTLP